MAFCEKCGAPLKDGARFCERCGAPVGAHGANEQAGQTEQAPKPASRMGTRRPTRRSPVPIVVGALLIVALIALGALYIVPLFIPHYHDPHEDMALLPPEERDGGAQDVSEDAKDEDADATEDTDAKDEGTDAKEDADTTQTTKADERGQLSEEELAEYVRMIMEMSSDDTGNAQTTDANKRDAKEEETSETPLEALDTSEPAQFDDFLWFSNDLMNGNTAGTPRAITDVERVKGGWKGYIYNYAITGNEYSKPSEEILNVYVGAADGDASLTFAWDRVRDAEGEVHNSMSDDMVFIGPWQGGYLEAQGMGVVRMIKFWEENGKQYAVGRISWPDNADAAIGLVRP